MNTNLLDFTTILRLAEHTLAAMPETERGEAVEWLEDNVMSAANVPAQLILFQSWMAVFDRISHDAMYSPVLIRD